MPPDSLTDRPGILSAQELVGTFRRFGPTGPAYKIESVGAVTVDGDVMLRISVPESGEKLDYRFSRAVLDAKAD